MKTKIDISLLIENQLPAFVRDEYPLFVEFLTEYYRAIEAKGNPVDIIRNIDSYVKLDNLVNIPKTTNITADVLSYDDTISVESTLGFPDTYGLIQIESEVILYRSKTDTSFLQCSRGFSGTTGYTNGELVFSQTLANSYTYNLDFPIPVINLNQILLEEFLLKLKKKIFPGFENKELYSDINQKLLISRSKDFYSSKGTISSFEILFKALYGEEVSIINPKDYLFKPSDAEYRITKDIIVEQIQGNPLDLEGKTLYQDQTNISNKSYGAITRVEPITRNNTTYYRLSLDYDYKKDINLVGGTVFGEFSITPKAFSLTGITTTNNYIDVDSTIGFPQSGELIVNGDIVTYANKNISQFLECSGLTQTYPTKTEVKLNQHAYANNGEITVRIVATISDPDNLDGSYLYQVGDKTRVLTYGYNFEGPNYNNWIFNVSPSINSKITNTTTLGGGLIRYEVETLDDNTFYINDKIEVEYFDVNNIKQNQIFVIKNIITAKRKFQFDSTSQIVQIISVSKVISKFNDTPYNANVQNVYGDINDKNNFYVCSNSLPKYLTYPSENLEIDYQIKILTGKYGDAELNTLVINNHGFLTGEGVVYLPGPGTNNLGISTNNYFVKKIDNNKIKLAESRENIYKSIYVGINSTVVLSGNDNKLVPQKYVNNLSEIKDINQQALVRNISTPKLSSKIDKTDSGYIGILINGVEILNYKSDDSIFYGKINDIKVASSSEDFDVINPPTIKITDLNYNNNPIGVGASAFCNVQGALSRIDIIDPGFDYVTEPAVEILGGNGYGAEAKVNLISYTYEISFSTNSVNTSQNYIGFGTYHNFNVGEKIIYANNGNTSISGLTANSSYYVSVPNLTQVKLHKNFEDSILGVNEIDLTSSGYGIQKLVSAKKKKKIGSIKIINSGYGYTKGISVVLPSDIDIEKNIIKIKNHFYSTGEKIKYSNSGTTISGLSTNLTYYVTKIDEDYIALSLIGTATQGDTFYLENKLYVSLGSIGSGNHIFSYEPITANIKPTSQTNNVISAVVNPIFKGKLKNVSITNGGTGYGDPEIINYNRQPKFELIKGTGAVVDFVISGTAIQKIVIISPGKNYECSPTLDIIGDGNGAVLTPIIADGKLVDVKIINGGLGYTKEKTKITVVSSGTRAVLYANIQKWTINLFNKYVNYNPSRIKLHDGVIENSTNSNYGLQYSHLYSPRQLRQIVYSSGYDDVSLKLNSDLENDYVIKNHSPILGWAYDGCPIYGPYGSDSTGKLKQFVSGYDLNQSLDSNRPPITTYSSGFFVEDYIYTADQNKIENEAKYEYLDEHNGRYCITPEYPNGVYAYFISLEKEIESNPNSPFNGYKSPKFPYFIGNNYKFAKNAFNLDKNSIQNNFNFNNNKILRNTTPYNLTSENSKYDFIPNPSEINSELSKVNEIQSGRVNGVIVNYGGDKYKVKDQVIFGDIDNENTMYSAYVQNISGVGVNTISSSSYIINNVEFYPKIDKNTNFIGISTVPHQLLNKDYINIIGIGSDNVNFAQESQIEVTSEKYSLSLAVGNTAATGIVTYFSVYGDLSFPKIIENDVFKVNNEQVKVLSVDKKSSRILVQREYNNTTGSSHQYSSLLVELPRKFKFNRNNTNDRITDFNRELYFNPSESVGIGTTVFSNIINISNPGAGETTIIVPNGSIYLENHKLKTGQKVLYSFNIGTSVSFYNSNNNYFTLDNNSSVYIAALNDNLIGISTIPVGIGSTGTIIGIGTTSYPLLYFTSVGSGVTHSFKTTYNSILGNVYKNAVTVNTKIPHNLQVNDEININCVSGIATSYKIVYNFNRRRLVVYYGAFLSSDLNSTNNTIQINNHKFKANDKIILTLTGTVTGLQTNGIYYVVPIDKNTVSLSSNYYNDNISPTIIDFNGTSNGSIYLINPELTVYKNSTLTFDVSDSSLSFNDGNSIDSAFEFKVYRDSNLLEEILPSKIIKIGKLGVDANASIKVKYNNMDSELYYNIVPVSNPNLPDAQKNVIIDDYFISTNNKITLKNSIYSGVHIVSGITSNAFTYNTTTQTELSQYTNANSNITYSTNSKSANGSIHSIKLIHPEKLYKTLPFVSSISSLEGSNAVLSTYTEEIGKIKSMKLNSILFNYSSDNTIRPFVNFPEIVKIDPLSKLKSIAVKSYGKNYTTAPELIVIDSFSNEIIDCELNYDLDTHVVQIIKNANTIHDSTPRVIAVNNSNGVGINSISYNSTLKQVTVSLDAEFSQVEDFPFQIGSKVFVENVQVISGNNYNSSDFNYGSFPVVNIDTNPGGGGSSVVYSVSEYNITSLGIFDSQNSSGKLIPLDQIVTFDAILEKNNFAVGEVVYVNNEKEKNGIVQRWDNKNKLLAIVTIDQFNLGQKIIGKTTGTQGIIVSTSKFNCTYDISPSSITNSGWQRLTGFLNEGTQRLHNNDYYQYFSYSIKSKVPYQTWNDSVSSLTHISGFKKFSDLSVESKDNTNTGISTDQSTINIDITQNLDSVVDLDNIVDYDLGYENIKILDSNSVSDEITFNSSIVQDYTESFSNLVLNVDDISNSFSSISSETKKTAFNLTFNGNPIFEKIFNGSNSQKVNVTENSIYIPGHFFRTGEKINYISNILEPNNTQNSIGIATTTISGIGQTDKLPLISYIYKIDDNNVKLCANSLDANTTPPKTLDISSVGIGSTHYIRSLNQNSRCLISIDNVIQSPIVGTAISTTLSQYVNLNDETIVFNNPLNFYGGDLIKINDELLKIDTVGIGTTNYVKVIRSTMGSGISTHSSGSIITKIKGNYNIIGSKIYFASPPYGATKTQNEFTEQGTGVVTEEIKKSSFQGRVYLRSSATNSSTDTYSKNYIYDDISQGFDAINKNYELKYNNTPLVNLQYESPIILINSIVQEEIKDYNIIEVGGATQLQFTGTATSTTYDPNTASVPRGGIILSVGSTSGYGYQPLVSAGGTAIIGAGGTISSISIGNSGSGYRSGIQTAVYVGIQTFSNNTPHVTIVGYSTVINGHIGPVSITNSGIGFTYDPAPVVVFDPPLSYTNIPLQYQNGSSGIGSEATIDIVVGQGSSIVDFNIKYFGYRYKVGDVLTIPYGGSVGIPTYTSLSLKPFEVTVNSIHNDNFSAWSVGSFDLLDDISPLFDGKRRRFPLKINGNSISYITKPGSPIDLNVNMHIYINNVLQVSGESYVFNGGSSILFMEPPRGAQIHSPNTGDTAKILFYRGTENVDIFTVDILETIKPGDDIRLTSDLYEFNQKERKVTDLLTPTSVKTNTYTIPSETVNILTETEYYRTINWKKQKNDLYIDGNQVNKNRVLYEPTIIPTTNIIQSVGIGSTLIFVEAVNGIFNNYRENVLESYRNSFQIISQSDTPIKSEIVKNATYSGDCGIVCGIQSTTYSGNFAFVFDMFIPINSTLRDSISMNNNNITESQIQTNNYFKLYDTRIGFGVSTLDQNNNIIGIGTTFVDNIYQVASVSIGQTLVPGIGLTNVAKVTTKVTNYNGIGVSEFGYNSYHGKFSWGVISVPPGYITKEYIINNTNGIVGLNSTPIIRRVNPLKFDSYTIT